MDSFFGGCSNLYTPGDKSKNLSENLFSLSKKSYQSFLHSYKAKQI